MVLTFELLGVIEARCADVDAGDVRVRPAHCVLRGLPRSAAGDEDVQVGAERPRRPEQMELGAPTPLVPPLVTSPIEVRGGWRVRMARVERLDRVRRRRRHTRHFTPAPPLRSIAAWFCRAFSSAWSMLKLAGRCRGGNSWNVFRNSPTIAWAGTSRNARSAF